MLVLAKGTPEESREILDIIEKANAMESWKLEKALTPGGYLIRDPRGRTVVFIEGEERAKLIEAVPHLLEACKLLLSARCECDDCDGSGVEPRTAELEDKDACYRCGGAGFELDGEAVEAWYEAQRAIAKATE